MGGRARAAIGAAFIVTGALGAGAATPAHIRALAAVEPGAWQLRDRDVDGATRTICLRDPAELVQLRHPAAACDRFLVEDAPPRATVRYACRGAGSGLTTIEVENPHLVQVDTQGMDHGAPFVLDVEARRTGACGGGA